MLQGKKASIAEGQLVKITKKYGTTAFMYTQYPHKRFWKVTASDSLYKQNFVEHYARENPTILYVHMPYCQQLCWFCTCHVAITQDYEKVHKYVNLLNTELDILAGMIEDNHLKVDFREIHLGGGSPTYINEEDFLSLHKSLSRLVGIAKLDEFAIEIDPRRVDRDRMHFYADHGINRISFGVQDFDLKIQEAINRIQPSELIENLIIPGIRKRFKNGVNFDILVGLPHQTPETMINTCKRIAELSPDRVCMNYMHYSPEFAKHQTIMMDGRSGRPDRLPDFIERKNIFLAALETLIGEGYVRTGYDHFAKPEDANAVALTQGRLAWNELGATPGRVCDCIALGVSGKSTIGNCYFQNFYELNDYENALTNRQFPIYSEHELSADELIRRNVIMSLRNYFKVVYSDVDDINFTTYFARELEDIKELINDKIVEVTDEGIFITEFGYQFANLVCRVFDKYYQDDKHVVDLGERTDLVQISKAVDLISPKSP